MRLIRKLGTRKNKTGNNYTSWGVFWCNFCKQEVEKELSVGRRYKSCGCVRYSENKGDYKHGGKGTKLYNVWQSIKQRILNPNNEAYKDYGGRGITICPEWTNKENGFINFRDWSLSNGYKEGLQINRINNDGNYEPSNCNFIPAKENNKNQRLRKDSKIKNIEIANEIRALYAIGNYIQKELASRFNISQATISLIINNKQWVK